MARAKGASVSVWVDDALLAEIDNAALKVSLDRSSFIRTALVQVLRKGVLEIDFGVAVKSPDEGTVWGLDANGEYEQLPGALIT